MSEHLLEGGVAVIKWLTHIFNAIVSGNVAHMILYTKEGSTVREA